MRILSTAVASTLGARVDALVALEQEGFAGAWLPSAGHDAMTVLALAAARTTRIELGTFVQATFARHPVSMAQGALAVQAASAGRFTLGLGLSHRQVVEQGWGMDFSHPLGHMREYLSVLRPLLGGEPVDFEGEHFRVHSVLRVPDAAPPPVVIAALGPRMLALAGELAEGTALWMAGRRYVEDVVVPVITRSAAAAGRPAPRIICGLPVIITADRDAARGRIARGYAGYGRLPSYLRVIEGSGAAGPEDVALIGTEEQVEAEIRRLAEAGVTDFYAAIDGQDAEARARTRAFLRGLAPALGGAD